MKYLKCRFSYAQYVDNLTGIKIGRGEIVPVKYTTKQMKRMLLKEGLLEVTQEEYQVWKAAQEKPVPPVEEILEEQDKKNEKPVEDELKKDEAKTQAGVVTTSGDFDDRTKKLAEKFKKAPLPKA